MGSFRASMPSIVLALVLVTVCLVWNGEATPGHATYYNAPYVPSACYGYDKSKFLPNNFIVAANNGLYNNGNSCGRTCQVSCYGNGCKNSNTISVRLVDQCPTCAPHQIDLSEEAFSSIADLNQGIISINYHCA